MRKIDRWDPEPVYAQLADILRGQIERGELVPGSRCRQRPTWSSTMGFPGTARRAVAMPQEGLVGRPQRVPT